MHGRAEIRPKRPDRTSARAEIEELRRRADAITWRLLYSNEPRVDIDIAIGVLREEVAARCPDRLWLFEIVYEARWERLRRQGWSRAHEEFL